MANRLATKLGKQIARFRVQAEFTQEELAERAGVWPETISRLERGRGNPSLDLVARLSKALAVPLPRMLNFGPDLPSSNAAIEALVLELANRPVAQVRLVHGVAKAVLQFMEGGDRSTPG
jgi:transcriptional regulator with XRE-family HTH domain